MIEPDPWRGAVPLAGLAIDHIGIVVAELAPTLAWLTQRGFRVSRPQPLMGASGPVGQASAHCVFANGYLEISAPVAGTGNHLEPLLARGPGVRILALRSEDIAADHARLAAAGLAAGEPRSASRPVKLTAGTQTANFVWFPLVEVIAGTITAMVEHRSRDMVFAPELRDHSNGATRMADVLFGGAPADLTALCGDPLADSPAALVAPALPAGISGFTIASREHAIDRRDGFVLRLTPGNLT